MRDCTTMMLLVAILGGCSDDSPSEAYGKAICERSFACCDAVALEGHEREQCEENTSMGLSSILNSVEEAEKRGTASYSSAKLEACTKAIKKIDCAQWPDQLDAIPACKEFIVPKVSPGAACEEDWECVRGHCSTATCAAYAFANETCDEFAEPECADGLYCDGSTHLCVAQLSAGEQCTLSSECRSDECNGVCAEKACYQGCASGTGVAWPAVALVGLFWARGRRRPR